MNPENKPGLNIVHGNDLISTTIGRLGALPTHLLLWTPGAIFKNASSDTAEFLKERFQPLDWRGNVEVYLNHSPFFRQLKRLFQKERRVNIFARALIGLPSLVSSWLLGKLFRTDLYNPFTESVQAYHANSAVAAHEIGHAKDWDEADHPTLKTFIAGLPVVRSLIEWRASHNAMKHLKNDQERQQARKVLEPAFGTYAAVDTLYGLSLGGVSVLGPGVESLLPFVPIIGAIAGHIHARTSARNLFYNDPKPLEEATKYTQRLHPGFATI